MAEKFIETFASFFAVLESQDPLGILDVEYPSHSIFIEPLPNKITSSFLTFLDTNKGDPYEKTTLSNERANYITIYDLYHDLHVACLTKMQEVENNRESYEKVDKFFNVSIEILLREAINLGVVLKYDREIVAANLEAVDPDEVKELSIDLENKLANQFDMITGSFYNDNGQALSLTTGPSMPFFTSLNNKKSNLDDREPIFDESLGIDVVNVIPTPSIPSDAKLESLTFTDSKLPSNLKRGLENYIHPNWLRLMDSQWLKHGEGFNSLFYSFAPTHDESNSVIYNEWRGGTWIQQVGFEKLVQMKKGLDDIKQEVNKEDDLTVKVEEDELKDEPQLDLVEADIPYNPRDKIDVRRLLSFNPRNNATDEEIEVVREDISQKTISKLILQLSELRQSRLKSSKDKVGKPGRKELETYQSIRRLMTGLINHKNVKPSELDLEFDPRLPVLQVDYCGTLPSNHMGATMEKSNNPFFGRSRRW